jgi:hypothetical protein
MSTPISDLEAGHSARLRYRRTPMKSFFLAALTIMSLGLSVANAATPQNAQVHRPNYYNWLEGGGG